MTVAGLLLCKDELDVLPYTLPRMAAQLDFVLVMDNMSTDGTREYLNDVAFDLGNISIEDDPEPAYTQSFKMTAAAMRARDQGATWIVPFDSDECWRAFGLNGEPMPINKLIPDVQEDVLTALLYDHVVTGFDDPSDPDPISRIGYRRDKPAGLHKVAARILPGLVIEAGNHGVHYPGLPRIAGGRLEVRHYPYRSGTQMARKARNGANAMTAAGNQLPPFTCQHWRDYGRLMDANGPEAMHEVFDTWFYSADPANDPTLVFDPCPLPMP